MQKLGAQYALQNFAGGALAPNPLLSPPSQTHAMLEVAFEDALQYTQEHDEGEISLYLANKRMRWPKAVDLTVDQLTWTSHVGCVFGLTAQTMS